jgi:hypothetical protein
MSKTRRRTSAERIEARTLRARAELTRRAEAIVLRRRPAEYIAAVPSRGLPALISRALLGYRVREVGQYGSHWRPTKRWAQAKAQALSSSGHR